MRIVPATRPTTFSTKKNKCLRTPTPPPPPTPPPTPPPQSPTIPISPSLPFNDSSLSPTISSSIEKPTTTTTTLSQRRLNPNPVKRMSNMMTTAVFIKDDKIGWKPAQLLSRDENGKTAQVLVSPHPLANYSIDYIKRTTPRRKIFRMASARHPTTTTSSLSPPIGGRIYNKSLSLGNVNTPPNDTSSPPRSPSPLSASSSQSSSFDDDTNDNDNELSLTPRTISLASYENNNNNDANNTTSLPLQDVDEWGNVISRDDLTDVPYLNEGTILWNLATRHEGNKPYTRAGVVICAVNPQRWIEGLYSEEKKVLYADSLVWNPTARSLESLPPHVYEASSLAYRGLVIDGEDQSILVSGESGAGKTETVKILMSHLATFEATKLPLDDDDDDIVEYNNKSANKSQRQEGLSANSKLLSRKGSVRKLMRKLASFKSKRDMTNHTTIEETTTHTQEDSTIQSPPATPRSGHSSSSLEGNNMNNNNNIIQRVLSSNPLLEAFGNAKTSRNDNSSRFSKYTRLQFRRTGNHSSLSTPYTLAGSICDTYLLQKSRVVFHFRSRGERTFHIMYMLLAAGDEETKRVWIGLRGKTPGDYRYVGEPSTDLIEGETDKERWILLRDSLRSFDVLEGDYVGLMRCLCVVLQLGNVSFEPQTENNLDGSSLRRDGELDGLCELLGVSQEHLSEGLLWKTMVTRGETFRLARNEKAVRDAVDALAKEIYSQTFDWLVGMINEKTRATATHHDGNCRVIGLLDIFGFETFETNYFEQLCINHANEKLQQKFTRDVFGTVRREYQEEGIDLENVQFQDNTEVLDLMEGRMGLIDLLNEECVMPGGSDVGFVRKVYVNVTAGAGGDLPLFKKKQFQRHQFGINHYAGQVVYDATHFVSKNIDALPEEIIQCVIQTNNHIIKSQFEKLLIEKKQLKKTLWTKFRTQLSELMTDIGKSHSRYVRCIVPNKEKIPYVTHFKYVLDQLRYAGVLSAIAMSRSTFPNRMSHEMAIDRFAMLRQHPAATTTVDSKHTKNKKKRRTSQVSQPPISEQLSQLMDQLLCHLKTISTDDDDRRIIPAYSLGKTRIYFRAGALECLEEQRLLFFNKMATVIQGAIRRKWAMERYEWLKKRAASVTKDQRRRRKGGGRMVRLKKKVWVMFRKPAVLGRFFRLRSRGRNGNRRKSITVGV